jgi:hypothetical protein
VVYVIESLLRASASGRVTFADTGPADDVFFAALWNLCGLIGVGENDLDVTDTGTCR